jgi:hypothetical protein
MIADSVSLGLSATDFSLLLDRLTRKQLATLNSLIWSGDDFIYCPKRGITVTGKGQYVSVDFAPQVRHTVGGSR